MVIDTSALVAITAKERDLAFLLDQIGKAPVRLLCSVSLLEAGMVLQARLGEAALTGLYQLIQELSFDVCPFDETQARHAITAFARYGKGMGHRAQLNFGDCAVYALAFSRKDVILALGNDFAATDVPCIRPT
jgi:ribonuclease VapC